MLTAIGLVKGPAGAGRANHFLDGSAGGPSIDQHIAAAIGGQTLLPSLELGVESTDTFLETLVTHMCYGAVDENDQLQAGDSDPARRRSGADLHAPDGQHAGGDDRTDPGGAAEPAVGARLRQERLRRSDGPAGQRRSRQAGSAPDQRPRHRDARRAADRRTRPRRTARTSRRCVRCRRSGSSACAIRTCAMPRRSRRSRANFCVTNFREIGKMQMDLMILALQCDLTRVASLQWSTAESTVIHEWLPLEYHGTREHHMMTHNESVDVSLMAAKVDQADGDDDPPDLTRAHLVRGAVRVHAGPAQGDPGGRRQDAARQHAAVLDQRAGRGRQAHVHERPDTCWPGAAAASCRPGATSTSWATRRRATATARRTTSCSSRS